jgi:hypothetical protein
LKDLKKSSTFVWNQMAARGGRGRGHGTLVDPPSPPPPVTIEQLMGMQAQLMQVVMDRLDSQPARAPPPVQVRDKHGEFMKGRPPVFTHAFDPLEADDG